VLKSASKSIWAFVTIVPPNWKISTEKSSLSFYLKHQPLQLLNQPALRLINRLHFHAYPQRNITLRQSILQQTKQLLLPFRQALHYLFQQFHLLLFPNIAFLRRLSSKKARRQVVKAYFASFVFQIVLDVPVHQRLQPTPLQLPVVFSADMQCACAKITVCGVEVLSNNIIPTIANNKEYSVMKQTDFLIILSP